MKFAFQVALTLGVVLSFAACKKQQTQSATQNAEPEYIHEFSGEPASKLMDAMRAANMPMLQDGVETTSFEFSFIDCREGMAGVNLCVVKTAKGDLRIEGDAAVNVATILRSTGILSETTQDGGKVTLVNDGSCTRSLHHTKGDSFSCSIRPTKVNF